MKEQDVQNVLTNKTPLGALIKTVFDLRILYKECPHYFPHIMQFVLSNPDEFKRLIQNKNDLYQLQLLYPGLDDVFGQSSVEDAITATHSRSEIIKSSRLMSQSVRTNSGFSIQLPT